MTREEIIEAISDDKMMPFIQTDHLANIVDFVIKNYHPSLPSNLDEAAEEFAWQNTWLEEPNTPTVNEHLCSMESFKAGAEWMAEQGCTVEIDEGYFINNPHHDRRKGKFHKYYSSVFGHSKKITVTPGDKVVVQIRKKETK